MAAEQNPQERGGTLKRNRGNFANDPVRAAEAGRRGGEVSPGNFANDPERAAAAGRKGGLASRGHRALRGTNVNESGAVGTEGDPDNTGGA